MTQSPLFDYQKDGVRWLSKKAYALLADEMGLGKTVQVIASADQLHLKKLLVICPAVARENWAREFRKWSAVPRDLSVLTRFSDLPIPRSSVICSFDYAARFPERLSPGGGEKWDAVVIDEVHFLKSIEAKRAKSILGKDGLVHQTKRVWNLSGTPAPNNASELWTLLYVFGVTTLSQPQFVERFCDTVQTGYGLQILGTKRSAIPELRLLLKNFMLRRRKADVLKDLPEIHYSDYSVEPGLVDIETESSFVQYVFPHDRKAELDALLVKERGLLSAVLDQHTLVRDRMKILEGLAPSISTLRRYTGLQKVEPVAELIKGELAAGLYDKVVIFAIHRDVIEGLRTRLAKFGPVTLYGGTDADKRQRNIDKFQKNKKTRVFIGNIQAAGTNITLTAAHQVVFIEQDWVPGNNAQAAMRCHRIGQTKNVSVRFISLNHPVDEKVTQILKRKTRELTEIFDS